MSTQTDPCCIKCRTPYGICATKYGCAHHRAGRLAAEQADRANTFQAELARAEAIAARRRS